MVTVRRNKPVPRVISLTKRLAISFTGKGILNMKNFMLIAAIASAGVVFLSACNMQTPSQVKTGYMRVQEDVKTVAVPADVVDRSAVTAVVADYTKNGISSAPVQILLPYVAGNPLQETGAKKIAESYVAAFAEAGVSNVRVDYIAVSDASQATQAVLSYGAVSALGPENCRRMTGFQGADARDDVEKYAFGCEMKTLMSKQIARPADLLGKGGLPEGTSRRSGTIVEDHSAGKPNEKLDGIRASSVGG